jgi:DNA modification methylase
MPEELASGLILSWSLPGDLVFDPFGGGCTTARMALLNDRRYLSMEIHEPYYRLAVRRMADAHAENRSRLDRELGLRHGDP